MRQYNDYLNPELFRTIFDTWPVNADYQKRQYITGLQIGCKSESVAIAFNGTWSAKLKDGGIITACEVIGYHACTADLLAGFLDSKVPILVYLDVGSGVQGKWLKKFDIVQNVK